MKFVDDDNDDDMININLPPILHRFQVMITFSLVRHFNALAAVRANTPFKVIEGHRFWYQSKAHIRLPISE